MIYGRRHDDIRKEKEEDYVKHLLTCPWPWAGFTGVAPGFPNGAAALFVGEGGTEGLLTA